MDHPLQIIFTGSGEFGLPTLDALLRDGHKIVQVVSQPDRPAGRGRQLTPTPIAQCALTRELPLLRTSNINSEALLAADVMVVIAFGQKIDAQVVNHPRLGSVNLHASRLPEFRGAAPINWAIHAGETLTGNSVIRLAQRMDAGAILGQTRLAIGETETAGELHDRLALDGGPLMVSVIRALADGTAVEREQNDAQATLAPKLDRAATRLDWLRRTADLCNQIRALYPWPGCRVQIIHPDGRAAANATLVRARLAAGDGMPGVIDEAGHIGTSTGLIEVLEIQPQGKRPMSIESYRNGNHWSAGMRVESLG